MATLIRQDSRYSEALRDAIKPLDLEQTLHMLDCQTWFPPSGSDRWEEIRRYVDKRTPASTPQEAPVYQRVMDDLIEISRQGSDEEADLQGRWTDIPSPKALYRVKYAVKTLLLDGDWFDCMNMGYADGSEDRAGGDGGDLGDLMYYSRKLYEHVARGAVLTGRDVLEVGVGRGGGARHLTALTRPARYVGIDLCPANIELCRAKPSPPQLSFKVGDAEAIPEPDESFDAVINIESAHCYPHIERFFEQVRRVLRPGGRLLLGTEWWTERMDKLEGELARSGLVLIEGEDITGNIITALENCREVFPDYIGRIEDPDRRRVWQKFFEERVCNDSRESYESGRFKFLNYVLEKP